MIRYINGDITKTEIKNIAHGVNCQNVMGSGVAKALYTKFPKVKSCYHHFLDTKADNFDPLGYVNIVHPYKVDDPTVYNLFTQRFYGNDGRIFVSYDAVGRCFRELNSLLNGQQLAIPKIGCGLAGGSWDIVKEIIDEYAPNIDIYVYCL